MQDRRRSRRITVLGTVMGARVEGDRTLHRVEATAPGGDRILLEVASKRHRRGPVRVRWDPSGRAGPRFPPEIRWTPIAILAGAIALVALGGWLLFGW